MLPNVGAIQESPLYANPKAPLRVSVGVSEAQLRE